jgi:alkanesulfonate monooxygenase SsuD/methylene tetrahydromethanopterin reductase-like flavin-dependent oxidoreductase (luciferase family)
MRIGLCLATGDMETEKPASLNDLAEQAQEAEELGFDSVWVNDHYWVEQDTDRRRVGTLEPMIMLAYIAARTKRVRLGTLVLCDAFRHPGQLAREAATLADGSGGRFILGIGAGWHEREFEVFGIPFSQRVSRLEETLRALPGLLAGERVTQDGQFLHLNDASIVATAPAAPVWVAAFRPRMIDLAAHFADGWHASFLPPEPVWFGSLASQVRAALATYHRDPSTFAITAGFHVLPVEGSEREKAIARASRLAGGEGERPLAERAVVGGPEDILRALRAYEAAGAEEVILNLSLDPFGGFDRSYPGRLSPVIKALR